MVFSERVATLSWLKESLEERMGFKDGAVRILHGGLDDTEQLAIIDSFKRENSPIKVLVTGDVASEGVNLHEQCHHLVHFDIPWSLIRIQQRNGRIDRYGQRHTPQICCSTRPTSRRPATCTSSSGSSTGRPRPTTT